MALTASAWSSTAYTTHANILQHNTTWSSMAYTTHANILQHKTTWSSTAYTTHADTLQDNKTWSSTAYTTHADILGAVALTVGSVPRRIIPELRHFHWLLKMNNQSIDVIQKRSYVGAILLLVQRPPAAQHDLGPYAWSTNSLPTANGTISPYLVTSVYRYFSAIVPLTSLLGASCIRPLDTTCNSIENRSRFYEAAQATSAYHHQQPYNPNFTRSSYSQ